MRNILKYFCPLVLFIVFMADAHAQQKRQQGGKPAQAARSGGTNRGGGGGAGAKPAAARSGGTNRGGAGSKPGAARSGGTSRGAARSGGTGRGAARSGGTGRGSAGAGRVGVFASEAVPDEKCPIGQSLKKIVDENGDFKYYVTSTETCDHPENAVETAWRRDMQIPLPLSWIDPAEAVVFSCDRAFIQRANPRGKTYCLDTAVICPIGVQLVRGVDEAGGLKIVDPTTEEACLLPALSTLRPVPGQAGKIELACSSNTFADVIPNAGSRVIQCSSCPLGFVAPGGAFGSGSCARRCPNGQSNSAKDASKCEKCSPMATYDYENFSCVCDAGFFGPGTGSDGCILCPAGSVCEGGSETTSVDIEKREFAPFRGMGEVMVCPEGLKSTGISCDCNDKEKMFNVSSGKCVPIYCPAGKTLDGDACKPCPAGSWCEGGDASVAPNACTKTNFCPEGSAKETNCGDKYCPKEGMSAAEDCPAGNVCKNGVIDACLAGYMFKDDICVPCVEGSWCQGGPAATAAPTLCSIGSHCPAGAKTQTNCGAQYCPRTGMVTPEPCPSGSVCKNGVHSGCADSMYFNGTSCVTCRAGYRCPGGVEQICPVTTFQDATGQTSCKPCISGSVCPRTGMTAPENCPTGGVCSGGNLVGCANGYRVNAGTCSVCPVGHRCPGGILQACTAGTFQGLTGQSACTNCAPGYFSGAGATSCYGGTFRLYDTIYSTRSYSLPAGTYRFELAGGGGGGGGNYTCHTDGTAAMPGGRGETIVRDFTIHGTTTFTMHIGLGGSGGASCCSSCSYTRCAGGSTGGTTTLYGAPTGTITAYGGNGGAGALHSRTSANDRGAAGMTRGNGAGGTAGIGGPGRSNGGPGGNGWIRIWRMG